MKAGDERLELVRAQEHLVEEEDDSGVAILRCLTERDEQIGDRAVYGRNRNGKNAFGKCVSTFARLNDDARAAEMQRVIGATDACVDDDLRTTSNRGKGSARTTIGARARGS